jgi:hypothetical protein
LKLGLSIVLCFVGAKMLLTDLYHVPMALSLGFIAAVLAVAVGASLLFPKAAEAHDPVTHDPMTHDPVAHDREVPDAVAQAAPPVDRVEVESERR